MADSYTLREAAEILGVSRRTLQRRIEEGAFPGRFIVPGRGGLETRVPAEDVERELEVRRKKGRTPWGRGSDSSRPEGSRLLETNTVVPREVESLVPYERPEIVESTSNRTSNTSALTQTDLESMRDAMLAIVREDREMFLSVVRDALIARDREIVALKHDITAMQRTMDGVRTGLESIERRLMQRRESEAIDPLVWADLIAAGPSPESVDTESLLREIEELEQLLERPIFS